MVASAWVNLLELAVKLCGFAVLVPFVWHLTGGWSALVAGGPPGFGSPIGMGSGAVLGLFVLLAPSFAVSPGLVQKTFAARTPRAAAMASLLNGAALAIFAVVPAVLGMATRALRPGLENPELALPVLLRDVVPPWLGALGLAALFAAEVSAIDAVLFMLATSLSKDLYKAFVAPDASEERLLRVSRLTVVGAGTVGVLLAVALPSVVAALKAFYGVMTAVLFVPLLAGLVLERATARQARRAVLLALGAWLGLQLAASHAPAWLPTAAALIAAAASFLIP
jgi:SSS family solute:Na+ symporter